MSQPSGTEPNFEVHQIKQILSHLATTPEVTSEAEYRHYSDQLRQMHARMDRAGGFEPVAMTYALMLRLQEYEAAALIRKAEEIWHEADEAERQKQP